MVCLYRWIRLQINGKKTCRRSCHSCHNVISDVNAGFSATSAPRWRERGTVQYSHCWTNDRHARSLLPLVRYCQRWQLVQPEFSPSVLQVSPRQPKDGRQSVSFAVRHLRGRARAGTTLQKPVVLMHFRHFTIDTILLLFLHLQPVSETCPSDYEALRVSAWLTSQQTVRQEELTIGDRCVVDRCRLGRMYETRQLGTAGAVTMCKIC